MPESRTKPALPQPAYRIVIHAHLDSHDRGEVERVMADLSDYLARPGVEFFTMRAEEVDPDTGEPVG